MDITEVAVVALLVSSLFATALGAPVVMARWAARSQALRAEQVMQQVLPGEHVLGVALGRARRPLPVTGAMVVLGIVAIVAAHSLGTAQSAVVTIGVVAALLVTHRRVLVAATPEEIVVIETTRDLEPVAVLGRIPLTRWQPTHGWGATSHPVGDLDIVVVGTALGRHLVADTIQTNLAAAATEPPEMQDATFT
ncbi:MAG: hypothetical protein ACRCSN_20920 [Dermatophilaceae bacterium]